MIISTFLSRNYFQAYHFRLLVKLWNPTHGSFQPRDLSYVTRGVRNSTCLSKLELSVRSKAKSLWAHDNLLWFLSFSNIIKYECRYSCTDSRDLAFNEIVRDMVYSNCFERDNNLTGAICSIFFVCGRTKCVVLVVTRIKNFLRYMYICFL